MGLVARPTMLRVFSQLFSSFLIFRFLLISTKLILFLSAVFNSYISVYFPTLLGAWLCVLLAGVVCV